MTAELITDPRRAAALLCAGKLVAFPTETVYGLGVDATSSSATERLFRVKGRPGNNPLIVHVSDLDRTDLAAQSLPPVARQLLQRFAPGPLTVVVPKRETIVSAVTAGLNTVGIRIPDHALALAMLRQVTVPIAAPSANRSGRPSATTWQAVLEDFGDTIDGILMGEAARVGLESTVVDCISQPPRILRPGGLSWDELRAVVPEITIAGPQAEPGENSPGRLHPHYRPRARVQLIDTAGQAEPAHDAAYVGLDAHPQASLFGWVEVCDSLEAYAHRLYEALREVDRRQLKIVYLQRVTASGLGIALRDRIERAGEQGP